LELDLETDEQIRNRFQDISKEIAVTGQSFYHNGWVFGTSGNLSAVVSDEPSLLAITGSGLDKGNLSSEKIILIDREMKVIWGNYRPSAETALHLTLVQEKSCRAVFHTHSIWSTILSQKYEKDGGIWIEGLEMLKSLDGVKTHEHREWIPILKNSQDMDALAIRLKEVLNQTPNIHGFMLSGHGLYTWGKTIQEAKRHVEGIEFILEVHGRMDSLNPKQKKTNKR
jgi:methylthioribulose-1-phosphate dehydratase